MKKLVVLLLAVGPLAFGYELDRKHNEVHLTSLDDFQKCINDLGNYQADYCLGGLEQYVKAHPKEAFKAGKLARLNLKHWAALPFFGQALGSKADAKLCADDDVSLAVISGLGLPESDKHLKVAQNIAKLCMAQLHDAIQKDVADSGSYYRDHACAVLEANGANDACAAARAKAEAANKPVEYHTPHEVTDLANVDASKLEVKKTSLKVFKGEEGKRVTIVTVLPESSNRVLVKFEGFKGPWDGQTLLHWVNEMGSDKADYKTLSDGKEWTSVTMRRNYGSSDYEVYVKGDKGEYHVYYDEKASGEITADAILKDFRANGGRGVASQ